MIISIWTQLNRINHKKEKYQDDDYINHLKCYVGNGSLCIKHSFETHMHMIQRLGIRLVHIVVAKITDKMKMKT